MIKLHWIVRQMIVESNAQANEILVRIDLLYLFCEILAKSVIVQIVLIISVALFIFGIFFVFSFGVTIFIE